MTVLLSTAYLAPVEYYRLLSHAGQPIIETADNYVKQTYRNRCIIASANGLQTLSIPILKPDSLKCLTKDIRIAD
ncbi:MAG: WbqC family protein, partial [Dysgonamonadaceae bacterium]|nr:WbqC family protein [Dysgonamonadaceae bacterium]